MKKYIVWEFIDYEGYYPVEFDSLKEARNLIKTNPKGADGTGQSILTRNLLTHK